MVVNIVIGGLIFLYAGYTLYRFVQKSKEGKCSSCSISKSCEAKSCCSINEKNRLSNNLVDNK
ncbi:FeoB-associated Cys-rich membrane protein [Niallia sp. 03133]|uniref:FeoB-associated Cys-rich membrane protein n=1 Tax=Niallia sp. 03133 TaxID=3458060 RepID=UPI0040449EDB